jgi:AmmeMemoRadiSam system protein A
MDESTRRGRLLLGIAREAILAGEPPAAAARAWAESWLLAMGATFVTLRDAGELRGCIGTVDPHRALGDDVTHNAHAAAYRDTRFPPLTAPVRERLEIEVSVLSARVPLAAASEREAAGALRPGIDGVLLEYGEARATFLPQVWESLPEPIDFLAELRRKARLPARFWHPAIRLSRYTVEKYR